MAEKNPELRKIEIVGRDLTRLSQDCEAAFDRLMHINSNNFLLLKFYGHFLVEAEGLLKKGRDLLDRASISEKSFIEKALNLLE